jgi:hypothetical protein
MTSPRQRLLSRIALAAGAAWLLLSMTPSSAAADEHGEWEFHVSSYPGPLAGACGARLEARAWSLPPESEAAVGLVEDGSFSEFTRVATTDSGFFLFDLIDPYPDACAPGTVLTFAVRIVAGQGFLGDATGAFEVISEIEMRAPPLAVLTVAAGTPGTCEQVTISGRGFPPDVGVLLFIGDPTPIAHDFAPITFVTSDSAGAFAVTTDYFSVGLCEAGREVGIYGWLDGPDDAARDFGRVSAVFTVGPPTPGLTGNSAPGTTHTSSRLPLAFLLGATFALALARTLTGRVSR